MYTAFIDQRVKVDDYSDLYQATWVIFQKIAGDDMAGEVMEFLEKFDK